MKTESLTRRSFFERFGLLSSAVIAGMSKPNSRLFGQTTRAGNPLRLSPAYAGGMLMVEPKKIEIWPGKLTDVFAINGSVPGPTIRVRNGDLFSAHVMNMLNEPLVLHWHGLLAPANMDGHPRDAVRGGQSYRVNFPVNQRAGTYWYHAHTDMLTGKQAYFGVAGGFIVEDPSEDAFNLPSADHDVILMLSDKRASASGQLTYAPTMMEVMSGFLGDTVLVNGTPQAYLSVDQGLYRFRLINASNARVYKIGLNDNKPFHLIGNDAGLLAKPAQTSALMLAPGGRMDLLVSFDSYTVGSSVKLISHAYAVPSGGGGGGGHGGHGGGGMMMGPTQGMELEILRFDVDRPLSRQGVVPAALAPFTTYDSTQAKRTRYFTLGASPMGKHQINGATFDLQRVDFTVPKGELEIWEIKDTTNEFHPIHPHGAHFQVMGRSSTAVLPPEDTGWKDTVLVGPNETVRLLIKFDSHEGIFVNHCHNLEHEDDGMMQNLEVKSGAAVQPSGPTLAIERTGSMLYISWPMSAAGYRLESRATLDAKSEWQPVSGTSEMMGDRIVIAVQPTTGAQFFRLAKL